MRDAIKIDKRGEFHSHQNWINKASSWLAGQAYTCVDSKGRVCHNGTDFQRAHDEGAFPVSFGPRLDKVKRLKWEQSRNSFMVDVCEFKATICDLVLTIYREHHNGNHGAIFTTRVTCADHGKEIARKWFRKRGVLEDKAVRL